MRRVKDMNEVNSEGMFREVSGRPAVSGMSPGVRGMVPIIYGKWLEGSGKFRKGLEGFGIFQKN